MKIYDISMIINKKMPVYKNIAANRPNISFLREYKYDKCNQSQIQMDLHSGTHIDAPFHMMDKGDTIDKISISDLIRECKVIDLTNVDDKITEKDLMNKNICENDFVLLKTKNSYDEEFNFKFVYLEISGANFLKDKKIKGVGIDSLGIERDQDHMAHKILFSQNIIIIEGLRLKDVDEGSYFMHALPLRLENVDGAPARVILTD